MQTDKIKTMLNKVPEITLYFWIIKILCTTVGETFADFLNTNLGLGLNGTTCIVSLFLAVALFFQFKNTRYIPSIYWINVVLISIVGTLITDNLTDNFNISLIISASFFGLVLLFNFFFWYKSENTLNINSINTFKREIFYWLTVLFTFALGTAGGDLIAESFGLGYLFSGIIFIGIILFIYFLNKYFKLNEILSFWLIYILTRPFGASLGDYLSQDKVDGGLGFGALITSLLFLFIILTLVFYFYRENE